MNFCKDCKHFCDLAPQSLAVCVHPESYRDPVYGVHAACVSMRAGNWLGGPNCGQDGKWFELKPVTEEAD